MFFLWCLIHFLLIIWLPYEEVTFSIYPCRSHKTEFNKKEIDIVTVATQNQLLQ